MLSQFSLEGYRSFAEFTSLRIAPITVLAGANSVGKSSVIDMLAAAAQSRQENSGSTLRLRGTWVDLGPCNQVIHWSRSGNQRRFSVGWTSDDGAEVLAEFGEHPSDPGAASLLGRELVPGPDTGVGRHPFEVRQTDGTTRDLLSWNLLYLGPYRIPPSALHLPRISSQGPIIGPSGAAAAEVLYQRRHDRSSVTLADGTSLGIGDRVNRWWSHVFDLRLEARAAEIGRVGFELSVDTPGAEGLGFGQVGLGLSQTFPILLLAALSEPGDLVAVQTPEAHLHPGAQHRVADVFLDLHGSGRQVILETHSEHLVNALRIAVRRGILAPDAVALHFFEQDSRGATVVQEIAIDPTGRLDRWPRGFFDQATQDLGELMR